jgi:hypothetical protein
MMIRAWKTARNLVELRFMLSTSLAKQVGRSSSKAGNQELFLEVFLTALG